MRGVVYKQRIAEEALNAILNGAQRQQQSFNSATDRDSWLLLCGRQDSCI